MDRVPGDVIYGLTLDGKGGMTPLAEGSEIPGAQPGWLHLDYGNPESARWLLQTPLLGEAARRPCSARAIVPSWCGWGRRCC